MSGRGRSGGRAGSRSEGLAPDQQPASHSPRGGGPVGEPGQERQPAGAPGLERQPVRAVTSASVVTVCGADGARRAGGAGATRDERGKRRRVWGRSALWTALGLPVGRFVADEFGEPVPRPVPRQRHRACRRTSPAPSRTRTRRSTGTANATARASAHAMAPAPAADTATETARARAPAPAAAPVPQRHHLLRHRLRPAQGQPGHRVQSDGCDRPEAVHGVRRARL